MRRRHVVATLITTLTTAGCLSGSSDSQQTALGYLGIVNRDEKAHQVDLRVRWENNLVHDRRYELAGDDPTDETASGAVPEQTWPDTSGQFTIETRLPETDWQSFDPASLDYPPCLGLSIQIDSEGDLAIFPHNESVQMRRRNARFCIVLFLLSSYCFRYLRTLTDRMVQLSIGGTNPVRMFL